MSYRSSENFQPMKKKSGGERNTYRDGTRSSKAKAKAKARKMRKK